MSEPPVIDINGALEQCGDDHEFLVELLNDLKVELRTQISKIDTVLEKNVRQQYSRRMCLLSSFLNQPHNAFSILIPF